MRFLTHLSSKLHEPMEHSGAISCSLKVDMDDAANNLFSCTGHWKPNDENTDTTCTGGGVRGGGRTKHLRDPVRATRGLHQAARLHLVSNRRHRPIALDRNAQPAEGCQEHSAPHLKEVHADAKHTEVYTLVSGKRHEANHRACISQITHRAR